MDLLPHKLSKIFKTYMKKVSELILKRKLRLHQLAVMDPTEIVVPFHNDGIGELWEESEL